MGKFSTSVKTVATATAKNEDAQSLLNRAILGGGLSIGDEVTFSKDCSDALLRVSEIDGKETKFLVVACQRGDKFNDNVAFDENAHTVSVKQLFKVVRTEDGETIAPSGVFGDLKGSSTQNDVVAKLKSLFGTKKTVTLKVSDIETGTTRFGESKVVSWEQA